ncbi:SprT-like family-domain-containing protein [Immersiella caudata]|uniref:SprT-like family-domain-containing protein n=1 Tax=Immersiella caudata TaxID=314043 RepID=A0AA40CAY7_9PEZI|nr:SprT-like family-domain-containing protein [Immersiella caudata]
MARPVTGGDIHPQIGPQGGYPPFPVKRRTADVDDESFAHKRPKYSQHCVPNVLRGDVVAFKAEERVGGPVHHDHHILRARTPQRHHSPHTQPHPARHHHLPSPRRLPSPEPAACAMERTASGHSIRADPTERSARTELLEDEEAEQRVRDHMANFRRRFPDSKHERILRSIINPRSNAEYPLDNDSLESIFSAANEIFFNGRLSQRVMWDWSHESSTQYDSNVIGTTALRRASNRGFETLIVLSSPILRDSKYSRRLLISTFLHELIHSYLFICCGFRARHCGGHTPAFQAIAKLIDEWAGVESALHLGRMEADLERFRIPEPDEESWPINDKHHVYYPCSGITEQQEHHRHDRRHYRQLGGPALDGYDSDNSTRWGHRGVRSLDPDEDSGSPYVYTDNMSQNHDTVGFYPSQR